MNRLLQILSYSLLAFVVGVQVSCKKSESDDLAKAQECLDNVKESDPTAADNCLTYVANYTSQQANILKCSILITSGGLMETKISQGYQILKDSTQTNKTASFMAVLNLDKPDIDTGYTKAVTASTYCTASGVSGLKYLSDIIVAGTYMTKTMSHLGITSNLDVSNPTAVNTAVNNLLTQCAGASPPASCTTDLPTLGSTVTNLAGSYCSSSSADQDVCGQVNSAVNSAGGSSAAVGQAMLCYLAKKTYNASTGLCQ